MSFELDVTLTLPGATAPVTDRRSGRFDDDTFSGTGTRVFETSDAELRDLWGGEPFEFRFLDQTLWLYNPISEPPSWGGFDFYEFAEASGGNPLSTVDGDAYVDLIVAATTDVFGVESRADGGRTWSLHVAADDLVPVAVAGGPASRLVDLGAAETGFIAAAELEENAEGHLTRVWIDLSEWWSNAIELAGGGGDEESMIVELRLEPFDQPLLVEAPCATPSETVDSGLTMLVCDP